MLKTLREIRRMNKIPTFVVEVTRTAQLTPRMRRVTVGGEDLGRFSPLGPDQFMYLLLPPPGADELTVGTDFTWTAHRRMPEEERPVGAYYTVRHHRPETNEIDLDMVLHPSNGEGGHASEWAVSAAPGDPVALWGPRVSYELPSAATDLYLFVDDTGLPAAACIIESLPTRVRAQVFIEVDGDGDHIDLDTRPGVDVTWLHRSGAEPGSTTLLEEAAKSVHPVDPATTYVYGGAESRSMKAIRSVVRSDWGLAKEAVSLVPYWRATGH